MSEPESQSRGETEERLLTLSEVSEKTGISMPTLQRYKKLYQGRIPSVGSGRKQRYPATALPVFEEIKNENVGRRGRPRKDASAPRRPVVAAAPARRGRKPAAAKAAAKVPAKRGRPRKDATPARRPAAAAPARGRRGAKPAPAAPAARGRARGGNLLTLTQISETTGISYPTLVRYVRLYSDRLPHEGKGRGRRFYPQAVDVFRQIRSESGRGGRKPGSGAGRGPGRPRGTGADESTAQRLKALEKSHQALEKRLRTLVRSLQGLVS
jgi:predicted DNA-binding transcriptional regulator AlpA